MSRVQVCGCREFPGYIEPFQSNSEAHFFGIYVGSGGCYRNVMDITDKDEAVKYAKDLAERKGMELDDKTFD